MGLAEKKKVLLQIVEQADDKLAGLIIALASEYNQPGYLFSDADIAAFNQSRDEYFANPGSVLSMDESLNNIRTSHTK